MPKRASTPENPRPHPQNPDPVLGTPMKVSKTTSYNAGYKSLDAGTIDASVAKENDRTTIQVSYEDFLGAVLNRGTRHSDIPKDPEKPQMEKMGLLDQLVFPRRQGAQNENYSKSLEPDWHDPLVQNIQNDPKWASARHSMTTAKEEADLYGPLNSALNLISTKTRETPAGSFAGGTTHLSWVSTPSDNLRLPDGVRGPASKPDLLGVYGVSCTKPGELEPWAKHSESWVGSIHANDVLIAVECSFTKPRKKKSKKPTKGYIPSSDLAVPIGYLSKETDIPNLQTPLPHPLYPGSGITPLDTPSNPRQGLSRGAKVPAKEHNLNADSDDEVPTRGSSDMDTDIDEEGAGEARARAKDEAEDEAEDEDEVEDEDEAEDEAEEGDDDDGDGDYDPDASDDDTPAEIRIPALFRRMGDSIYSLPLGKALVVMRYNSIIRECQLFRTGMISIVIQNTLATLIYTDHSGTIISPPMDIFGSDQFITAIIHLTVADFPQFGYDTIWVDKVRTNPEGHATRAAVDPRNGKNRAIVVKEIPYTVIRILLRRFAIHSRGTTVLYVFNTKEGTWSIMKISWVPKNATLESTLAKEALEYKIEILAVVNHCTVPMDTWNGLLSTRQPLSVRDMRIMVYNDVCWMPGTELNNKNFLKCFLDAMIKWRKLWKIAGILHRDISSGNVLMGRLPNGELQGYPIDLDHSIRVKDPNSNTGEPKGRSSAPHRTGTAPFMALDHLKAPRSVYYPSWHLPRYDIESFIWVLCWTIHHFKVHGRGQDKHRKWRPAPVFDEAFHDGKRASARARKFDWARSPERALDEIDPSWESLLPLMWTLVEKVVAAYQQEDIILAKYPNPPPSKGKGKGKGKDVEMADGGKKVPVPDFFELDGAFRVDDVIQIVADFYAAM